MSDLVVGLDLGQLVDATAAVVLRRSLSIGADGRPERDSLGFPGYRYDALAVKRYELGTSYASIVEHIVRQLQRPECYPKVRLCLDASGVGRPILEQFRAATKNMHHIEVWAITITGGNAVTPVGMRELHVSKIQLVAALHAAMGLKRLTVPPTLPFADVLKSELGNFQVKVTASANEVYAAREGMHDDLVISLALATWLGGQRFAEMDTTVLVDVLPGERDALDADARAIREAESEAIRLEQEGRRRGGHRLDDDSLWEAFA